MLYRIKVNDGIDTRYITQGGFTYQPEKARKFDMEDAKRNCVILEGEHGIHAEFEAAN